MAKLTKSYSSFTIEDLRDLGIRVIPDVLFPTPLPWVEPSGDLKKTLSKNLKRPLATEKAKSELIITPVLNELQERNEAFFTYFSGYNFDVDKKLGLRGFCDFIFSKMPNLMYIEAPIFTVVEAKNADIDSGIPQCVAELYAAKIFNAKHDQILSPLYGTVTTGFDWRFIRFENDIAVVDSDIYALKNLPELLGVLQNIIDQFKK
jgi:hypothetical protein